MAARITDAVAPGADLDRHAHALLAVHDAVMSGDTPPAAPRPLVSRSWSRVLEAGLDPSRPADRAPLPMEQIEHRRTTSPLAHVVREVLTALTAVADASHFIVVVTDADGVILWRQGSSSVLRRADRLGFQRGARWTEDVVGTNAIGTALAERAPVQLFAAEHFEEGQHPWYCTATPVHDPRTGALLGVIDVSGPALTMHPAVTALVETTTALAEMRLREHHAESLRRLRRSAEHLVATSSAPVLVVDDDGWVAHGSGVPVRDRIPVPREGRLIAVPGLGLCLPERLPAGWLVRTPSAATTGLEARLRTVAGSEVLDLVAAGDDRSWFTTLTPRHAQILRVLAGVGASGCSAAQLSRALFADEEHQVTVRAEVSRLRRVVGGLVTTGPYRIADDVHLVLDPLTDPLSGRR